MKLLFIYNANSGLFNALCHAGHKLVSPSTYMCSLCALTYDTVSENKVWRRFRAESHLDMEFYHKDEFEAKFPSVKMTYPTILKLENAQLTTVLNSDVLNKIKDVVGLIERLKLSV
ncbi:MAG: GTPase [Winogradskyella sp.]|uniref:GTPase n=1 Tax=Winogradskyella sp. TaxID=1883156 RepID=UPI00385C4F58